MNIKIKITTPSMKSTPKNPPKPRPTRLPEKKWEGDPPRFQKSL